MGNILLLIQQSHGKVSKGSLSALSAAFKLKEKWGKGEIVGIVLGQGASQAADDATQYGLSKVFFSESAKFEKYLSHLFAVAVQHVVVQAKVDTFVVAATSTGKDLAPRIAALLDAGQASEILSVNEDGSLRRPMYAGNVFADVEILTSNRVVTVRATSFAPAQKSAAPGLKVDISDVSLGDAAESSKWGEVLSYQLSGGERPELSEAEVVVSGGRAMQSAENFEKYIYPLAESLHAAVGASRAAVDSGYAPNDWQVGQTGKIVAPNLYVAVGISGAIQHLAGMKDSKVIVAINKDGDAPIFEVADFGLVADLFEAVPNLTAAIKKAKG